MKKGLFILLLIMVGDHLVGQVNMPVRGSSPDTAYIKVTEVTPGVVSINFDINARVDTVKNCWTYANEGQICNELWHETQDDKGFNQSFVPVSLTVGPNGKRAYSLVFINSYGTTYIWVPEGYKHSK